MIKYQIIKNRRAAYLFNMQLCDFFVICSHSVIILKLSFRMAHSRLIANGKEHNITDGLRNLWRREYEKYKDIFQEEVMK